MLLKIEKWKKSVYSFIKRIETDHYIFLMKINDGSFPVAKYSIDMYGKQNKLFWCFGRSDESMTDAIERLKKDVKDLKWSEVL